MFIVRWRVFIICIIYNIYTYVYLLLLLLLLKNKEDASTLITEKESLNSEKERLTALEREKEETLKVKTATIGNIVHKSVPTSLDEADNEIIKKWEPPVDAEGDRRPVKKTGILSHHEVLYRIDGYDPERGIYIIYMFIYFFSFLHEIV